MHITRRIRGVLGMATTWGVFFSVLSTVLLVGARLTGDINPSVFTPGLYFMVATRAFVGGALAGAAFALILASAERRRSIGTLSKTRVALWGFLGAVTVQTTLVAAVGALTALPLRLAITGSITYGLLGAALATGIVQIARRAPAQALEHGDPSSERIAPAAG